MSERIIREPECEKVTGLSRTTRWRLERQGRFPRRRRVSPNCVGWLESELDIWLRSRPTAELRAPERSHDEPLQAGEGPERQGH